MSDVVVSNNQEEFKPNFMNYEERQEQIRKQKEQEREALERAKKSPFKNFVQVNKDIYKAEDWLMGKSPIAYRVFRFLVNNMDGYNAVICSQTVIKENFNVSRQTVSKAIKLLKDRKYIDVYKSGTSNVYAINKNLVWNSYGTNFKFAKFGANIIISESEQEKNIKAKIKAIKHKEIITD